MGSCGLGNRLIKVRKAVGIWRLWDGFAKRGGVAACRRSPELWTKTLLRLDLSSANLHCQLISYQICFIMRRTVLSTICSRIHAKVNQLLNVHLQRRFQVHSGYYRLPREIGQSYWRVARLVMLQLLRSRSEAAARQAEEGS